MGIKADNISNKYIHCCTKKKCINSIKRVYKKKRCIFMTMLLADFLITLITSVDVRKARPFRDISNRTTVKTRGSVIQNVKHIHNNRMKCNIFL